MASHSNTRWGRDFLHGDRKKLTGSFAHRPSLRPIPLAYLPGMPAAPRMSRSTPVLRTSDYSRARTFYADRLGFECIEEGGEPARFGIFKRDDAFVMIDGWGAPGQPHSGWDAYIHVRRLDEWRAAFANAGVECPQIETKAYGMREFVVRDPDGNAICFGEDAQPEVYARRASYVLAVHDLDATQQWYEQTLGCTSEQIDPNNWVFMKLGNVTFMAGRCPDAMPAHDLGDHSYLGYVTVDDVNSLFERVERAGADLLKPLRDEPWGMREFGLRTVDGHRFMFGEPTE